MRREAECSAIRDLNRRRSVQRYCNGRRDGGCPPLNDVAKALVFGAVSDVPFLALDHKVGDKVPQLPADRVVRSEWLTQGLSAIPSRQANIRPANRWRRHEAVPPEDCSNPRDATDFRYSRNSSISRPPSVLLGPGQFGHRRRSPSRRWSSPHPRGRAIRRSPRRGCRGGEHPRR